MTTSKQIVCRCEDVTLEELTHAVELGHRDIESLKRYTGFGTGWCQGKACLVPCALHLVRLGGDPGQGITPRPPYHPVSLAALAGMDPEWD
ncbi:MAG TPA: (2Fe-2S)-binding protein [Polyangiaceae bacterium]|nr:(2Fe-2S)-binding protein [Polyangiaceae bacterium]